LTTKGVCGICTLKGGIEMSAQERPEFNLSDKILIYPPVWPECEPNVQPGDLSKYTPYGSGFYGYQERDIGNPFTSAPWEEEAGGKVYFGNGISMNDFVVLMRILQVVRGHGLTPLKDFAAFIHESEQPAVDGYLVQMRVVSKFALRFLFDTITEVGYKKFPEQQLTVEEALWAFIEHEKKRWGTSFTQDYKMGLQGLFGGNGDSAREELSFGFMVENSYYNIYRIWSRAWLVTK
jgi:hypothetical protein